MTKHNRTVLSKVVNDPNFKERDACEALDKCRSSTHFTLYKTAVKILQENEWDVDKPVEKNSK